MAFHRASPAAPPSRRSANAFTPFENSSGTRNRTARPEPGSSESSAAYGHPVGGLSRMSPRQVLAEKALDVGGASGVSKAQPKRACASLEQHRRTRPASTVPSRGSGRKNPPPVRPAAAMTFRTLAPLIPSRRSSRAAALSICRCVRLFWQPGEFLAPLPSAVERRWSVLFITDVILRL